MVIHRFESAEGDQQVIVEQPSGRAFRASYPKDASAEELRRFLDVLAAALVLVPVPAGSDDPDATTT
jgi:hypothetical protein